MADKKVEGTQYYSRPVELGRWEGFKQFLWNGETSEVLGRTGSSWAKILFFYLIFYSALCGFFAAMLAVFYTTLNDKMPKWQLDQSLIGSNPGLGFRPMPPESNVESTLIWYNSGSSENTKHWVDALDEFLKPYQDAGEKSAENAIDCTDKNLPREGQICKVDMSKFSKCVTKEKYSYPKGSPCVFLKLNKIYAWKPEVYNDHNNVPQNMPNELKDHIKTMSNPGKNETNVVWISCEGENPADIENIGSIQYIPQRGFPTYFFPYMNQPNYLPPLVAIRFEGPRKGVLINIECKAWAKNIVHDRMERRGSVHFELMVD